MGARVALHLNGPRLTRVRALRFHAHGAPSVLQVDEVAGPRPPRGDELLVEVVASSINGTDLGLRRGDLPAVATWGRLPFTPGFDLAGVVVDTGPGVTAFARGDRVMALLGHGGGAQAERVVVRQSRAALCPRTVETTTAAAIPLAGLTALQALQGCGHLQQRPRGARVLVLGASGGIGSYAVQLAKDLGAHVTGVARAAKHAHLRDLGADEVVDRRQTDVSTLGDRYDVVLDAAGVQGFAGVGHLLVPDGRLVSVRPLSLDAVRGALARRLPAGVDARHRGVTAVMTTARSQDLTRLAALVDAGRLRVPVDATYPLKAAREAHEHAEREVRGKVVLTLG